MTWMGRSPCSRHKGVVSMDGITTTRTWPKCIIVYELVSPSGYDALLLSRIDLRHPPHVLMHGCGSPCLRSFVVCQKSKLRGGHVNLGIDALFRCENHPTSRILGKRMLSGARCFACPDM